MHDYDGVTHSFAIPIELYSTQSNLHRSKSEAWDWKLLMVWINFELTSLRGKTRHRFWSINDRCDQLPSHFMGCFPSNHSATDGSTKL